MSEHKHVELALSLVSSKQARRTILGIVGNLLLIGALWAVILASYMCGGYPQ